MKYRSKSPRKSVNRRKTAFKRKPRRTKSWAKGQISKGELRVMNYLRSKGISYIHEAEFSDCFNPQTRCNLRFDFFLPKYSIVLEYQGIQHEQYVPEFDGKSAKIGAKKLQNRKFKDEIKREYCKHKGFTLIEIPSTEFDTIPEFLDKNLII